jgi:predicted PhzF superfamily epimerase YddE/YHI9
MTIPYFEVVAFSDRQFAGNPAGVCVLAAWLPDPAMQAIAAENNLSETASSSTVGRISISAG